MMIKACKKKTLAYKEKTIFNWENVGWFYEGDHTKTIKSLPMIAALLDVSLAELPIWTINIKWKTSTASTVIAEFKNSMNAANPGSTFSYQARGLQGSDTTAKIKNIMNIVFDTIIIMVMLLCFFALSANMTANLYE